MNGGLRGAPSSPCARQSPVSGSPRACQWQGRSWWSNTSLAARLRRTPVSHLRYTVQSKCQQARRGGEQQRIAVRQVVQGAQGAAKALRLPRVRPPCGENEKTSDQHKDNRARDKAERAEQHDEAAALLP